MSHFIEDIKEEAVESIAPFVGIGIVAAATVAATLHQAKAEFPKSGKGFWILIPVVIFAVACI